eukprot:CAMPEP_0175814036 /NCGR_PEP_ID=MMETSP0107_2-20121207/5207_1 /TAXON_ID=195067 ORGANISM="Goniomonas pacifica, Strain CCMP1869" /NCGR_SAMPLE_ID=MMETSP0107_2 /ASSEMBLY_ACC=CAM_ASM_000203 /LENGTH=126 /DNA_ID=CAMNT_0017125961 /DNA_START=605 /DNA_END=985 /DNA_ORIENTATION=-
MDEDMLVWLARVIYFRQTTLSFEELLLVRDDVATLCLEWRDRAVCTVQLSGPTIVLPRILTQTLIQMQLNMTLQWVVGEEIGIQTRERPREELEDGCVWVEDHLPGESRAVHCDENARRLQRRGLG